MKFPSSPSFLRHLVLLAALLVSTSTAQKESKNITLDDGNVVSIVVEEGGKLCDASIKPSSSLFPGKSCSCWMLCSSDFVGYDCSNHSDDPCAKIDCQGVCTNVAAPTVVAATVAAPTVAPVDVPVDVVEPTGSPVKETTPSAAPVAMNPPTTSPVKVEVPTGSPVKSATDEPTTSSPTEAVVDPTESPVEEESDTPSESPVMVEESDTPSESPVMVEESNAPTESPVVQEVTDPLSPVAPVDSVVTSAPTSSPSSSLFPVQTSAPECAAHSNCAALEGDCCPSKFRFALCLEMVLLFLLSQACASHIFLCFCNHHRHHQSCRRMDVGLLR